MKGPQSGGPFIRATTRPQRPMLPYPPHPPSPNEASMTLNAETTSARRSAAAAFEAIPTGAVLGVEIKAGDLRTLDDISFARVVKTWHDHSVVLFRDQALSDHDLVAFSRCFGDLDIAPIQENGRRFVE